MVSTSFLVSLVSRSLSLSCRNDLISRPLKYAQRKEATEKELALGRSRASALVGLLLPHFWLRR